MEGEQDGVSLRQAFMFDALEQKRTPAESKTLVLEILGAIAACAVVAGAATCFSRKWGIQSGVST